MPSGASTPASQASKPLREFALELDREWHWTLDELWNSSVDSDTIIGVSSSWCIRNVDSLITRHLHAHRYGIEKWPRQWGQWSHGEEGLREFEQLSQKQGTA